VIFEKITLPAPLPKNFETA